ncbi:MAG: hypothetical protein AB7T10_08490 [bacterium]
MKVRYLISILVILIFSVMMTSCFLFPKVEIEDTKSFINDFEETVNDPTSVIEGENGTLAMGATQDFFSKGGTSKGGISLNFLDLSNFLRPTVKTPQLLLDTAYGTYTFDTIEDPYYTYYDFVLTNPNDPANGYLFKWNYTDTTTIPSEDYLIGLRIDSLLYYAGDEYEETPTRMYIAMEANGSPLMFLNMHATYTTLSDEYGDWFSPITLETHLEVTDESAVEVDYVGHNDGDTIVIIDSLRAKMEDKINDEWVEYTVKMNDDETTDFTMENNEGWFMAINAEDPTEIDSTYTRVDFTGEVQKDGTHAADLLGVIWQPTDYYTHLSVMYVTYPDGTADTVDLNTTFVPETK